MPLQNIGKNIEGLEIVHVSTLLAEFYITHNYLQNMFSVKILEKKETWRKLFVILNFMKKKLQSWEKAIAEFQGNLDNTVLLGKLKGIWVNLVPVGFCYCWENVIWYFPPRQVNCNRPPAFCCQMFDTWKII